MSDKGSLHQLYLDHVLGRTQALLDSGVLAYHEDESGDYFHRPGEVLATVQALPALTDLLQEIGAADPEVEEELAVARIHLPDGRDVHDTVTLLRETAGLGPGDVGPHHVLFGAPRWHGCPGRPPSPGTPVDLDLDSARGQGVVIAVLDTGQSEQSLSSAWVATHVRPGAGIDHLDDDGDGRIDLVGGHGTFITGILAQVAPAADVVVLAPLSPAGLTDDLTVARAVKVAHKAGAQLLNLSFGGYTDRDEPPIALAAALADDGDPDAPVAVAAAGNDAASRPFYPAALEGVVAVAALNAQGRRARFSNFGSWVDAAAAGDRVLSSYVDGTAETDSDGDGVEDVFSEPWAYWSGTSFAAPQVVGALAVRMSETGETAREAVAALVRAAGLTRVTDVGVEVRTSVPSHRSAAGRP